MTGDTGKMPQYAKVLAARTSDLNWSLGPRWWEEETDLPNLFFDLYISAVACMYIYMYRHINNKCIFKSFQRAPGGRETENWGTEPVECRLSQESLLNRHSQCTSSDSF